MRYLENTHIQSSIIVQELYYVMKSFMHLVAFGSVGATVTSPLWPEPAKFSLGSTTVSLAADFSFSQNGSQQSMFLDQAINRYNGLISASDGTADFGDNVISSCLLTVSELHSNEPETLQTGVDESYSMTVDSSGACSIESQTVWGALHGMESFTQLLQRSENTVFCEYTPVSISDSPRFTHRGLLIDSSRHYLPVSEIERLIDSLPMNKFNALHWHMVDAQVSLFCIAY